MTVAGSCRKSCKPCTVAEIPDDVVNFFNNSLSSAVRRVSSDDDDVGLLQLDSDTTNDGLLTSDGHVDTGNLFCATLCVCYHQCVNCSACMPSSLSPNNSNPFHCTLSRTLTIHKESAMTGETPQTPLVEIRADFHRVTLPWVAR